MELDAGFGSRVKWAINYKDSSQSAVARHIGRTPQAIQQWVSGETKSPRKDHVEKAASFLGVRFEWLAYGRGPMRGGDDKTTPAEQNHLNEECAILSHEWETSLRAALPDAVHDSLYTKVPHPSGLTPITVGWVSDAFLADFGLYKGQALNLIQFARQKLWMLAVMRAALPPVAQRRTVLILSPLEQWRGSPEKHIEALRAEARVLGIEVLHCITPEHVAALLTGNEDSPEIAFGLDLGLEISPVLQ